MLAPLVMSFLAQRVMSGGLNSSQLGNALGQEKAQVQQQGGWVAACWARCWTRMATANSMSAT
ncbi:hypothetical protein [Comamonas sp. JC664]|uniref:hypothetical protein n=1 Tax=Comamonas sp. JC664 TaxID=2801917 RepID=UPI00360F4A49